MREEIEICEKNWECAEHQIACNGQDGESEDNLQTARHCVPSSFVLSPCLCIVRSYDVFH